MLASNGWGKYVEAIGWKLAWQGKQGVIVRKGAFGLWVVLLFEADWRGNGGERKGMG